MTPLHKLVLSTRPALLATYIKKLLRVRRKVESVSSGRFLIDPVSKFGMMLVEDGEYEPQMAATLNNILKPGNTFVDIGANEGYFTVLAAKIVGPAGRIVAVEPQKRVASILRENVTLNSLTNVAIVTTAISDQDGQSDLYLSPDTNTGSTSLIQTTKYRLPTQPVETSTLSALFDRCGIQVADLVKMDIEGFEYEAILGSPEIFKSHRVRYLALELHRPLLERKGLQIDSLLAFLADCGYVTDDRFENLVLAIA